MNKLLLACLLVFPALASAAITFPVAPDSRWTLVDVRTTPPTIVSTHREWWGPDANTMPVGFDGANYALLREVLPSPPVVDDRYYQITRLSPTLDVAGNTITWAWSQTERPEDEKIAAAETEEGDRHDLIARVARELRDTHIMVSAMYAMQVKGFVPGAKVVTFMDNYLAQGVKLRENWQRFNDYVAAIKAGTKPDLSAWPHPAPMGQ